VSANLVEKFPIKFVGLILGKGARSPILGVGKIAGDALNCRRVLGDKQVE